MGTNSLAACHWGRIALVALLALTFGLVTVAAGQASGRGGDAVVAKKKCKKKGKKSAAAAKKKCKRKHSVAPPTTPTQPTQPTQPASPVERVVLTWDGAADLDAHAWSNGLHDGWSEVQEAYLDEIPGTTYTSSDDTPNRETVVQTNPNPLIPMTFSLCYYAGGGNDAGDVTATVKSVHTDGIVDTDEVEMSYGQDVVEINGEGGLPDDPSDWCPAPI